MIYAAGMKEARRVQDAMPSEAAAAAFWAEDLPDMPTFDTTYTGADGQPQAARMYRGASGPSGPAGEAGPSRPSRPSRPVVLYIHGGGWVGGSIALNEPACRALALGAGVDVFSVSYRLAPAHPFPAGLEDCRAALAHLRGRASGPDSGADVVLAGASAGANLALALALDEEVAGLVLFYGLFGDDLETESHQTYATRFGLTSARVAELLALYDPGGARRHDPRVCPLSASDAALARLPPVFLLAAECDVLCSDTQRLADRLFRLGKDPEVHVQPGVLHGFINRGRLVPAATRCLDRAARFLTTLAAKEKTAP